jgi:hypothetical protein
MLRHTLSEALTFVTGLTAVKTRQPFFAHLEVWPDIFIDELRVAMEYDTPGAMVLSAWGAVRPPTNARIPSSGRTEGK